METIVIKDWGHSLDDKCFVDQFMSDADFKIEELLDFDFSWPAWSHDTPQINSNGSQYSSSSTQIPSMEDEDLMQIEDSLYESGESVFQLDCGVKGPELGRNDSVSGCSTISTESTETQYGSISTFGGGLIAPSSDSAEYRGLRLVYLLTACAEAMQEGSHDLVEIILSRLRDLVSATGSTMERVAYYLTQSLRSRHYGTSENKKRGSRCCSRGDFLGALSLLNQVYPYMRVAHFTANQSILECIPEGSRPILHIVDFDIMEGLQWPPLMEALKSEDYNIGHLKITAIRWEDDEEKDFSTGKRLSEYACSLGIPFSFHESDLGDVNGKLRCSDEEIVIVNSMWGLPHMIERGKKDVAELLHGARFLNPSLVTVGTGPRGIENHQKLNLVERFSHCLTNLCAVFDSSEAGLTDQFALARAMVERLFLGPMMCRTFDQIEDSEAGRVVDIPWQCGFVQHPLSPKNIMFAELMASNSEYRVECSEQNRLLLRWNSTSLTSVSTWKLSP